MSNPEDEDDELKAITYKYGGFKIVDASGQRMPKELVDAFVEALIEEGQLVRNADGTIEAGPNASEDGKPRATIMHVDDDGTLTTVEGLDVDVPPEFNVH